MRVGYLRISSEDQAEGLSPEIQRAALLAAGAEQIFEDLGRSGFKNITRAGFEDLLKAIEAGKVTQVITNTYSRLSRNAKDSARLDEALLAAGATVLDLGTGQEYEPAELTPELLALLARQESRAKSKRLKQTFQSFRDAGLSPSHRAPWGIRIPTRASKQRGDDPPDAVERVPIRDDSVYGKARAMVDHYLKTGCSHAELFRYCLANDIPLRSTNTICKWLRQPMVERLVLNAGEPAQIEKIAARHKNGFKRSEGRTESHWMRGLVLCDRCGKPMGSANKRQALKCMHQTCPNTKQVRTEMISWAISAALSKATETAPQKLIEVTKGRQATQQELDLQKQQKDIEQLLKKQPTLGAVLEPQVEAIEKQLRDLASVDLSFQQTMALDWLKDRSTVDWYLIPLALKPRIYRALIKSVSCDEGMPVKVILADGTLGEPPEDWLKITNNLGVIYGTQLLPDGTEKPAPLSDDTEDLLGWERLISGTWEDSLTPSEREELEAWRAGENATHAETVATGPEEYQ